MHPHAAPDYPYDQDNPFRTETQRQKSLTPAARAAEVNASRQLQTFYVVLILSYVLYLAAKAVL